MPSRTLPTFPSAEISRHKSAKSCYVTVGTKVYDVTSFLQDHPGGAELILQFAGTDVKEIMEDEVSHAHSESAWEMLDECLVGFVATPKVLDAATQSKDPFSILPMEPTADGMNQLRAAQNGSVEDVKARSNVAANGTGEGKAVFEATGMSSEDDLHKETNLEDDFKQHQFLDLNKPLLLQVWFGGFSKQFYLEQVHRPRHYKGGASAPLFGNFLEPLSKTAWWVVPTIWLPMVALGLFLAGQHLHPLALAAYWTLGVGIWTLVEYGLHRCLFHVDQYLPDNRVFITLHFLLHGIHHYLPMDRLRLVMPPTLFLVLAAPFWKLAHTIFAYDWNVATAVFCGGIFGYVCYDLTHFFLHHASLPAFWRPLKKYHLQHHFMDYENGFGVTSRFWDRIFGTELPPPPAPKILKSS